MSAIRRFFDDLSHMMLAWSERVTGEPAEELREAKKAIYQLGWHEPGRSLADDIEALGGARYEAEIERGRLKHQASPQ